MTHVRGVHAAPTYACPFCELIFGNRTDLSEHEEVHFNERLRKKFTLYVLNVWNPGTPNSLICVPVEKLLGPVLDDCIPLPEPLLDVLEVWDPGGLEGLFDAVAQVPVHCFHLPEPGRGVPEVWDP